MAETLADLTALEARDRMARGDLRAADLMEAQLHRILRLEPRIGAFAYLEPEAARAAARRLDGLYRAGEVPGPLHGVAVGIKDIIDTADMPTENGTPLDAGRRPVRDAEVVRRLRAAGAIVIGKTVTTELASMHPRGTHNPHDVLRTPGGSSSGSAAAVAAGMIPLALGTQTNGSMIRPASFCGVVGYKPGFGLVPRTAVLPQAASLDTIGVFARTVADAAMIVDVLAGPHSGDPDCLSAPAPALLAAVRAGRAQPPRLAFVRGPAWHQGESPMTDAMLAFAERMAPFCQPLTLPAIAESAAAAMHLLGRVALARSYGAYYDRGRDQLSEFMRSAIEEGRGISAGDHRSALAAQREIATAVDAVFDRYDAVITPAAPGEAPPIATTGNPAFNSLWSICGTPAVSLPLLKGTFGLPIGVQVVGRRGNDASLLATADWLSRTASP